MASHSTRLKIRPIDAKKCSGHKTGWRTKAEALDAAERMMDEGAVRPGCHITPYRCDECHDWHVTNRIIVFLGKGQTGWS